MNPTDPQTFEDAVSRFKDFLHQSGYSTNLIWVEPTDLILPGRHGIYVKVPAPPQNLQLASERFTSGMSQGFGVAFGTIREFQNATCCYAWVPNDRTEQEEHMMDSGLKVSANTGASRMPGIPVTNGLHWYLLKLRHRKRARLRQHLFG